MSIFYTARRVANILLRGSIQVRSYSTSAAGQKKNPNSEANVKSKKKEKKKKPDPPTYFEEFFARYPEFKYNPSRPIMKEFYRMSDFFAWDKGSTEKRKGLQGVRDAISKTFNDIYGTNVKCLRSWHNLCRAVYIDPLPQDIHSCRKRMDAIFVNICDLVDTPRTGEPVKLFSSERLLAEYSKDRWDPKIYPRKNAYARGLLRYLLRHIMYPREGLEGESSHILAQKGSGGFGQRRRRGKH